MNGCGADQFRQASAALLVPGAWKGHHVGHRAKVAQIRLGLFFLGSVVVSVPLALADGHAGSLAETTSGKIPVAALLAIGFLERQLPHAILGETDSWFRS